MKRLYLSLGLFLAASTVLSTAAMAQTAEQPEARSEGISSRSQIAAQTELEKNIPKLNITDDFLDLLVPGETMGEPVGVSVNSKSHIFVYTRTHPTGIARGANAAKLWEFDQNGKFVKEWGPHNYAKSFAHSVRVDKHDNVWEVDEGSGMIIKYNPQGIPVGQFGRTPEAIDYLEEYLEHGGTGYNNTYEDPTSGKRRDPHPKGGIGNFDRPTDVAWDSQDNIYVTDGYNNSRIVKIAPGGHWLKEVGTFGNGKDQFHIIHGIALDNSDTIYVADRNNSRVQVYDTDLNYQRTYTGMGSPWSVCVSPAPKGQTQFLYSGDGTTGKIYKMSLDGKVLGWAQTSLGRGEDDNGRLIHQIACAPNNVLYLGSAVLWNVQKITIH